MPVTAIFRPVRLIAPVLLEEVRDETVIWFLVVVRFRFLPLINDAGFPTVILPAVALVKFTVRSSTKLAEELPKLNAEPETVPPLSLIRIEARPNG